MKDLFDSELEAMAAQCLGKLLFTFGRLETNLAVALGNAKPQREFENVMAKVAKLSFAEKLKIWEEEIIKGYAGNVDALACWDKWFTSANSLRDTRNRFAHGRWGFLVAHGRVAHVTGVPGDSTQYSTFYTLDELAYLVSDAQRVADEFSRVYKTFPIYG